MIPAGPPFPWHRMQQLHQMCKVSTIGCNATDNRSFKETLRCVAFRNNGNGSCDATAMRSHNAVHVQRIEEGAYGIR